MANLFKKAAAVKPVSSPSGPKKRETVWRVGQDSESVALAESVTQLVELAGTRKAIEAKEALHKSRLKKYAEERWLEQYGGQGVQPETPMKIVNQATGASVTFVVQDRSTGHEVKDEVADALGQLIGEGAVGEALFEQQIFSFNPAVMAQPLANGNGDDLVQDWLGEKLGGMVDRAVRDGVLTQEQADALLAVKHQRTYRPGFFDRLPHMCGLSVARVQAVLDAIGSAVTRYVKA